MSSKQIVNASEGICFRLANVVSLHQLNEKRGMTSEKTTLGYNHDLIAGQIKS